MKLNEQDILTIVNKLVGSIEPVGSSHIDKERYENLVIMSNLIEDLCYQMLQLASKEKQGYASVDKAIERARLGLLDFKRMIGDVKNETK